MYKELGTKLVRRKAKNRSGGVVVAQEKGFTLIEVLIVVAIVAILVSVAVPSYQQYSIRAHRSDAVGKLINLAQEMEAKMTLNGSYMRDDDGDGEVESEYLNQAPDGFFPTTVGYTGTDHDYDVRITTANNGATYQLDLVPNGRQANDTDCGTLSIDNAGRKTISGSAANITDCFKQ